MDLTADCRREIEATGAAVVADLPDGRILIVVAARRPNPWRWLLGPVLFFIGLLCVVGSLWWYEAHRGEIFADNVLKFTVFGSLFMAMGVAVPLFQIVIGRPKESRFEVGPAGLKAERSIAGDRVTSHYGPDDIPFFFIESGILYVQARMGPTVLFSGGDRALTRQIAQLLAISLWGRDDVATAETRQGAVTRVLLFSSLRAEADAAVQRLNGNA